METTKKAFSSISQDFINIQLANVFMDKSGILYIVS